MTIEDWLASACADADGRGLADLKPLLSALAEATRVLRAVDWDEALAVSRSPVPGARQDQPPAGKDRRGDGALP